jgi:hypothetical protein
MPETISRSLIVDRLGDVRREKFLVYLMGPYKSFNLEYVLSDEERADIKVADLPGPLRSLFQHRDKIDDAQALLRRVQGALRVDPGVNAFLALDVGIGTDEIDAATQSIQYARCANLTAFILPYLGHNFGIGEEAGSILEALCEPDSPQNDYSERLVFAKESEVTSTMIQSANSRWDVEIHTYDSEAELVETLRLLAGKTIQQEQYGNLDRLN